MSECLTEINVTWNGDITFIGQNASGGIVQMGTIDGKPGVSPMQLLLVAIAGCTAEDILYILQKKHINLTNLQVRVSGKRAEDYPKIWTDIHITYLIWGKSIKHKDIEQAINLSEDKYCSVGIMLRHASKITSEFQILKPGETAN